MPFTIVRNDISKVSADVVVNAANERLAPGGGVCGAIFAAAGYDELLSACEKIGRCATGDAVATPAFNLDAKWIVHTVGPVWRGGGHGEEARLRSCYRRTLEVAEGLGARSVALPLISAGIYGYPQRAALEVATEEIRAFLAQGERDMDVTLVVFSRSAVNVSAQLRLAVQEYVDDVYVGERESHDRRREAEYGQALFDAMAADELQAQARADSVLAAQQVPAAQPAPAEPHAPAPERAGIFSRVPDKLKGLLDNLDASFSQTLLALIDKRGLADAEVYKRANISRQLFSKIRKDNGYKPSKPTALALAVALELSLPETEDLLARAGLALSHSSKFDVIVEYFIRAGIYDIYTINEVLFAFDQQLLGS